MARNASLYKEIVGLEQRISLSYASLEIRDILKVTFRILEEDFGFEDILYVSSNSAQLLLSGRDLMNDKDLPTEGELFEVPFAVSASMTTDELQGRLSAFAKDYPLVDGDGWMWTSSPKQNSRKAGQAHGILALADASNGAPVGYFYCSGSPRGPKSEERVSILFESLHMRLNQIFTMAKMYMSTKALNFVDDLTGLYNSRYMSRVLDTEISRVDRDTGVFSVLFVDVDHLKRVNDEKGHLIGSQVLVEVGKILQDAVRTTDYAFRYGGDEFILVLVGADEVQSQVVAERIRSRVEKHSFRYKEHELRVTLSLGIAAFPKHAKTRDDLIRMADEAMYAGKRKSRNTVFVAS